MAIYIDFPSLGFFFGILMKIYLFLRRPKLAWGPKREFKFACTLVMLHWVFDEGRKHCNENLYDFVTTGSIGDSSRGLWMPGHFRYIRLLADSYIVNGFKISDFNCYQGQGWLRIPASKCLIIFQALRSCWVEPKWVQGRWLSQDKEITEAMQGVKPFMLHKDVMLWWWQWW